MIKRIAFRQFIEIALVAVIFSVGSSASVLWILRNRNAVPTPEPKEMKVASEEVIGNNPERRGLATAPSTLVVFMDYQCPPCRRTEPTLKDLPQVKSGKLQIVIRNFPLKMHPEVYPAAIFAEVAREQKHYWTVHDTLIASPDLKQKNLEEISHKAGVAKPTALQQETAKQSVERDLKFAEKLGLSGTPSLLLCTPDHKVTQVFSADQIAKLTL